MRALYCLLGDPVAHSRSPAIHARAFALLGVDAVYAPCRVTDVPGAIRGLRALSVSGANVTVPHKVSVMPLLDRLADRAGRAGAVNCIVNRAGALEGHNTDAVALEEALGAAGIGRNGVVLGAGGSARAAASVLERSVVVSRSRARAEELLRAFPSASAGTPQALAEARLVVNCTPLGMDEDTLPADPALLRPDCAVVDFVYAGPSGESAFVRAARARGLRAIDGIELLVRQAVASLELWLGRDDLGALYSPLREAALS